MTARLDAEWWVLQHGSLAGWLEAWLQRWRFR